MTFSRSPETLLAHHPFLESLARAVVADPAGRDDVLQEVWLASVKRPPRDPATARAWLARVLRNLAGRQRRSETRRRRREERVARPETIPSPTDVQEREELRRRVVEAVLELDERYATVLLGRYYHDLSPAEMARALDLPVETVRTRLRRGLERLRERLDGEFGGRREWGLALLPFVDLRPAGGLSWISSGVTGGVIMMQKIGTGVVLATAASLVAGFGLGRYSHSQPPRPDGETPLAVVAGGDSSAEVARLETERASLMRSLDAERTARAQLREELEETRAQLLLQAKTAATPEPTDPAATDWEQFASFFADHLSFLEAHGAMLETEGGSLRDLSPQHQALYRDFLMEWSRAAAHARESTPYPFLSPDYLPSLLDVVLGETLGLDDGDLGRLQDFALAWLETNPLPEDASPVQAHALRLELVDSLLAELVPGLHGEAADRWDRVAPSVRWLLEGDRRHVSLGLRLGDETVTGRMLHEWELRYGLDGQQKEDAADLASRMLERAKALCGRFERMGEGQSQLTREEREMVNARFFEAQLQLEEELLRLLTPEQRERMVREFPALFIFDDSMAILVDTVAHGGF